MSLKVRMATGRASCPALPSPTLPPGHALAPCGAVASSSAICTALVAAPLRRLSLTHQKANAIRPLNVLTDAADEHFVAAVAVSGIGYCFAARSSMTTMPGAAANNSRASSADSLRSVSTRMLSLWQLLTGTRTQVGQTWIDSSPRIFRVSWTIFISSDV